MSTPPLPDKRAVRRSFAGAAATYDANAFLQREIADRLFERLEYIKLTPSTVLDLGCGTGTVTKKLAARFPEARIVAFDLALPMLMHTREAMKRSWAERLFKRGSDVLPACGDAEALPFATASLDAVVSSLTLQWCDAERAINEAARILKPGGLLMFTTFGPDTLKELKAAFRAIDDQPHVNTFTDMHDLGDMMVHAGLADPVMDQEVLTLTYAELKPLLKELKGIGAHNVLPGRSRGLMGKSRWKAMVEAYENFRVDGRLPATYEVVYGHAWKPALAKQRAKDGAVGISIDDFKRMVTK
ncbi:MAG: malonyl-ACP O-methyltransferase BioC, partial [Betaproteobacteria bacterium]|nr:malonyl-ACP O-methyltransferase BioC [Betaproteobacteria bacterium]